MQSRIARAIFYFRHADCFGRTPATDCLKDEAGPDRLARYCGSRFSPFTSSIQTGPSSATIFSKKT